MDTNKICWGISMVMFLSIAITAILYLLAPIEIHEETIKGEDSILSTNNNQFGSMLLVRKAWIEYPEYNFGMGTLSGFGFVGAIVSGYALCKGKEDDEAID